MTTTSVTPAEGPVLEILDAYLAALRAGRAPDREALLARHPDLAESLAASFRALDFVQGAGRALEVSEAPSGREEPSSAVRLLGDFRILRELGRGGMAVVYEAEQVSLGRHVALKVLPFAAVLDSKQLQRFKNEAQAAAQLQHPHIVPVHAVGCERGVHYYAMQYVEGQSLDVAIREMKAARGDGASKDPAQAGRSQEPRTPISSHGSTREPAYVRMAATLGVQAAEALDYAHHLGIVHRDMKPGNLLVDRAGTLWITDFGLAHSTKDVGLTITGELLGTIRYMSPEQALAKRVPVDHRTDVYSLGATLYELLTLEPAFPGDDAHLLIQDIATKEPVPPRRLNPALPRDLETVLLKAMAKDPGDRYATAGEMADDLVRFLENRPVEARRPGPLRRATQWSLRHRALVGAAAGVLLLAVAGLAIGTAVLWREKQQTQTALARADANLFLALKALDEIYIDEAEGRPRIRDGLPRDLLQKGLEFYEKFAAENARDKDVAWLVGVAYTRASLIFRALDQKVEAERALDRAISVCREAIRLQPDLVKAHVSLGNAFWIRGDLDDAILEFRTAIQLQPDDAGAHNNLGIALLAHDDLPGAIEAFKGAVRLTPRDANAHNELGMAYLKKGDIDHAIQEYDRAIQLQANFAAAHANLGAALFDQEDFDGAIRECTVVVGLQPDSAQAHLNLGNALRAKKDLKGAIHEYGEAIRLQKDSFLAHYFLGCVLGESGDRVGESREYGEAIRLRPYDSLEHLMTRHVLAASVALPVLIPMGHRGPVSAAEGAPLRGDFEGSVDPHALPEVTVIAKGTATQLGEFSLTMPHVVDPGRGTAKGTIKLVAANGDELVGTFTGIASPPEKSVVIFIVETATITDGTGRFAGATGSLTIERFFNRKTGATTGRVVGAISAPASGD